MRRLALALAALAACGGPAKQTKPAAKADTPLTPAQIAELALPSVVLIQTPIMLGTGFVVWGDGRIATNLHVIAGAREAKVTLTDKRQFGDIQVLAADPAHDLAIIRIAATDLKPLALGDSAHVKAGERVVTIGHPLGLGNTVSDGIVSGVRDLDPRVTLLQITAPIAPGSSGGPIFNDRGEVVGVATLYASEGQNVNFGVPVAYLKPMLLGEDAVPLAVFGAQVPDTSMVQGCTVEDAKLVANGIGDAIKAGAPKFNAGDKKACADIYEKAALKLVGDLKGCQGVRDALLAGVSASNKATDDGDKAWALRHTFDRIMGTFAAAMQQAQEEQEQQPPPATPAAPPPKKK